MSKVVKLETIEDLENKEAVEAIKLWDPVQEIDDWVVELQEKKIRWKTELEWNAPRKNGNFHPSSLHNQCDMFLFLQLINETGKSRMSATTQQILDTGTIIHEQFQYYLGTRALYYDYDYDYEYPIQNEERAREIRLTGHVDGYDRRVIKVPGYEIHTRFIWDFKTAKDSEFESIRNKAKSAHVKQFHAYMYALDVPFTIALYYNKNNSLKKAVKVFFDESIWDPIEERLRRIIEISKRFQEPDKREGPSCAYCAYVDTCNPRALKHNKVRHFRR